MLPLPFFIPINSMSLLAICNMRIIALSILAATTLPLALLSSADTTSPQLALHQGDRLRGECSGVTEGVVAWRTAYGGPLRIPLEEIRDMEPEGVWDLEFLD